MSKLKSTVGKYNPSGIEKKWQDVWEKKKVYSPNLDKASKPFYNLMMFPYPSAEGMHVGNMYAFTGADVYGRFQRMRGFSVFEPIGLDGFGIHSENYAIKVGKHPQEQARISEKNFYRQLKSIGNGFDWAKTIETYKPEYYRWTQWLFIQLFKAGLAYRKKAPVNFCPSCKTVLADEQVEDGKCERCSSIVEKRDLEQWFFKITKYADRLLNGLSHIDWAEKVKITQRQWIGKSEGVLIKFKIKDLELKSNEIEVFTTRPDTLFGATFLVLSPEHALISLILKTARSGLAELKRYVEEAKKKTLQEKGEIKEKAGVFTGLYAINPVNNEKIPVWIADYVLMSYGTGAIMAVPAHDERDFEFACKHNLPIKETIRTVENVYRGYLKREWSKDFDKFLTQLMGLNPVFKEKTNDSIIYEVDFSKLNQLLEIIKTSVKENAWNELAGENIIIVFGDGEVKEIKKFEENREVWEKMKMLEKNVRGYGSMWEMFFDSVYKDIICYISEGKIVNSQEWNGWKTPDSIEKVMEWLGKKGLGKKEINYHLRDWLISRQRYWGPPIPMINCDKCSWQPVSEEDLPVELPYIRDYKPLGTGVAPLANHPEFYKTKCPKCAGEAKRETDVSDTFLDSAWYFLRYVSTDIDTTAFDQERVKKWLPVNMHIGGAEHSVLHLLYSRFITMALKDLGFIDFEEPFVKFRAHGLIVKDGAKMSKSKGNVVIPDEYIRKFGADALRTYLMFMGPFSQGGDFRDTGIEGMHRFLKRVWTLFAGTKSPGFNSIRQNQALSESLRMMHKTIKKVTEDILNLSYNTAIAGLMEWYNFLSDQRAISREEAETFLKLSAPFAPHISEELYQLLILPSEKQDNKKNFSSICNSSWPTYDLKFLAVSEIVIVIQVNGKLRGNIVVDSEIARDKAKVEDLSRSSPGVARYLDAKKIEKIIYVEGKVLNFVTGV